MFSLQIKKEIREHALSEVPNECNGLLLKLDNNYQVYRCKNLSYNPTQHAILSPLDYLRAESQGQIVGYYHSQKNSGASLLDGLTSFHHNLYSIIYCIDDNSFHVICPKLKDYLFVDFEIGKNDCFSLVRNYYKDILGIEINNYYRNDNWYIEDSNVISKNFQREGFKTIDIKDIKENDIILFGDKDDIVHLGIYLKNDLLLHHPRFNKSCIEYLNQHYKNRISMVIRYEQIN